MIIIDNMENAGGPAFPLDIKFNHDGMQHHYTACGMTLRDYFAAKAMQGILTRSGGIDVNQDAEFAYKLADAMLKARAQP